MRTKKCPACRGSGKDKTCQACNGTNFDTQTGWACRHCNAQGKTEDERECFYCKGRGKILIQPRMMRCDPCGGTGHRGRGKCSLCFGSGKIETVQIPIISKAA